MSTARPGLSAVEDCTLYRTAFFNSSITGRGSTLLRPLRVRGFAPNKAPLGLLLDLFCFAVQVCGDGGAKVGCCAIFFHVRGRVDGCCVGEDARGRARPTVFATSTSGNDGSRSSSRCGTMALREVGACDRMMREREKLCHGRRAGVALVLSWRQLCYAMQVRGSGAATARSVSGAWPAPTTMALFNIAMANTRR